MIITDTRGTSSMWDVIIWAIIVLVVGLIVILSFNRLFAKGSGSIGDELGKQGDYDGDSVADRFDQCMCVSGEQDNGCPLGKKATPAERFLQCPGRLCTLWGQDTKLCTG